MKSAGKDDQQMWTQRKKTGSRGDEELEMGRQSNDFVDVMFPSRVFFQLCWTVVV